MAAGSMSSNAVSSSIQAAGSSRFFHSSHSPNSLLLQNKKTLAKLPKACLRTRRVLGLGVGLYHKNTLTARSNVLMRKTSLAKTLVNVFSEHTVTTEEEETESNAGTAAIGVDEESLVEVKDNVGRANESTNGSNLPESNLFSLDTNGSPHEVYNEGSAHEDRVVAAVQEENGAAGPESSSSLYLESNGAACLESHGALSHKDRITAHGENIAPYLESNGSTHAGSSGAMSIGGNGAADNENNEAPYSERNGAILEERSSIANATDVPESGFKDETTEVARVVCNGALPLETISSPVRSEEGSLDAQFQSDRQPDTTLQPYSLSLSTDEDGERSAKDKVESIGQEDPWFKQAGQSKIPVSITPGGRWNQFKTYSTIQRTLEIWFFVATFLFKAWLINQKFAYKGGITEEKKKEKRSVLAKWLKEGLLRLGPTFIKIGQQFSTRVDILPQEYVDQLAELQDQVPPFESEIALKIVEEELGAPVGEIFEQFDPDPIAAASLGQVHRAVFKNEEVVVKVQRPGLKELFDIDLKNLRVIAENLQKLDPKSDGAKRDWVAIYDECASVLYQEIDYCKEGANAERFANNFKDLEYVRVPKIYWECTTPQVLTMEYVPGIKINRIAALDQLGVDRKKLAQYAVESYLEQILRHGFFHADPHPGNIAVDDENGGRLIFYDFGMMGSVSSNIREGLLETFYGVYEKDPDKVLQAMVQMGVLVPTGDMTAVRRTAQFFLNSFEERLAAQRAEREATKAELGFKKRLTKEERIEKKKMRLAAIGEDLLSISVDQPFRFPATFTFVVRAFSVLDGIGKGLDPRFDISEIAKPYALEILKFREVGYDVIIRDFKKRWKRQAQAFSNLFRQADRVEKLAEVIERLEQGDLKLRVRTLESERAFKRMATMQQTTAQAVLAGVLLNLATILQLHAVRAPAFAAFVGSAVIGVKVLIGLLKVKKLDKQEKLITGTA